MNPAQPIHPMKYAPLCLSLLLYAGTAAHAQVAEAPAETKERIRYQLILPDEKAPEVVKPNEPNPFAKSDANAIKAEETSSEENRVKDILKALGVSGKKCDPVTGMVSSVMLGDMRLERGAILPPVIADQTVRLRVNSLSDTAIEMFWVEKNKRNMSLTQRTPFIIPINLGPTVRTVAYRPVPQAATPDTNGKGAVILLQNPGGAPPAEDPPVRRAVVVDETGTSTPEVIAGPDQPRSAPGDPQPGVVDDKHPANLLLNIFRNKSTPTQAPQPK